MRLANDRALLRQAVDDKIWRCPVPDCRSTISIRKGSFFEQSKLPLTKLLDLIYMCSLEINNANIEHQVICTKSRQFETSINRKLHITLRDVDRNLFCVVYVSLLSELYVTNRMVSQSKPWRLFYSLKILYHRIVISYDIVSYHSHPGPPPPTSLLAQMQNCRLAVYSN